MKDYCPLVSIVVIDYKKGRNPLLVECLEAIGKQTYSNYEIILVTDYENDLNYPKLRKLSYGKYVGPAEKRDEGGKMAKGEILAFIDDDAYPSPQWLEKVVRHFQDKKIVGVGGPGVTPPKVSWQEQASGWASASPLGAGPYTYRFLPGKKQFVDDYPSMNLAVRRSDFLQIGGYDSNYWPGEDTKLCLDLVHKLGKKIIYDPEAIVYHHRRPLWKPHLRQNGNFGLHRGYFARVLPKTSFRPSYVPPSLMFLGLSFLLITNILGIFFPVNGNNLINLANSFILGALFLYCILLSLSALWVFSKSHDYLQAIISIPAIFLTHCWYGIRFMQGYLFTKKLSR